MRYKIFRSLLLAERVLRWVASRGASTPNSELRTPNSELRSRSVPVGHTYLNLTVYEVTNVTCHQWVRVNLITLQ